MKINRNIHLTYIKNDDLRPALSYAYFFKKYVYITDSYILIRINKRDFFDGYFSMDMLDNLTNRMIKISDLKFLRGKEFKLKDKNFILNDSILIKSYYYNKMDYKLKEEVFERLFEEKESSTGNYEYSKAMTRAMNLFQSDRFQIENLGSKTIITHKPYNSIEEVKILVMNQYVG